MTTEHRLSRIEREGRAAPVTMDAPPVHVTTTDLVGELIRSADAPVAIRRFVDLGGHTRDREPRVGELDAEVGRSLRS